MAKRTLEEAKKILEDNGSNLEILDDEYLNPRAKMRFRCTVCGYEFTTSFDSVKRGTKCARCMGTLKKTIEEVVKIIGEISPSVRILSKVYVNARSKLECECKICSHHWSPTYDALHAGKKCPKCSNNIKKTLAEVKTAIHDKYNNIVVLDTEYLGVDHLLHLKCTIDSYEWETSYHNIMSGHNCPKCLGNERITIELARSRTDRIAPNIEILSKTCNSTAEKLECKCKVCGNIWDTNLNNISNGTNCIECFRKGQVGENHPQWKGGITDLNNYLRGKISPWRADSIEKDNSKCVITGEPFEAVHHLYGFSTLVQDVLEKENLPVYPKIGEYTSNELERLSRSFLELHYEHGLGICLTKKLHENFHNLFGYGFNTPSQFEEFLKIIDR